MQDYIKRYFWALGVVVALICAVIGARAANHVIEAKLLGDAARAPKIDLPPPPPESEQVGQRSKVGEEIAKRNMFCSDCAPPEPAVTDVIVDDPDQVPLTSLPLNLVATNVSSRDAFSFATIQNTQSESQGAYWIGSTIPGAGVVEKIQGKFVDFRNDATKRLERISLLGDYVAPARPTPAPTADTSGNENRDELTAAIDDGIKKLDDNNFEISRELVDKLLANPMSVARGARIVPSVKNGKANGFKLYAIRPSSIYAKLGMMNGDTIHAINGFELTTPDKALEVYTKVKSASNLSVSVTRRGKPATIGYSIR